MHILELPSFFPPHGGLFCLDQAKALKAMGHEVRIVSVVELSLTKDRQFYFTAPPGEERREMDGVEVFGQYMRAVPKAVRRNISHWTDLCQKAVERYVRRYGRPDVLHAHCCKNAGLAARAISERLGIPFFITEHLSSGLFERDFGEGWQRHVWLKEEMRRTYEGAACVIPVSSELVDDLAPFFGKAYRHQVISNIVDTDFFCPSLTAPPPPSASPQPSPKGEGALRRDTPRPFREGDGGKAEGPGESLRPFRFCCLALADIYGKGYDVLAEAMQYLPENVELHIAGQGTRSPAMRKLFPQSRVHLHGFLDKAGVRDLLWRSDALVLPSRSEAQPLVLLEALATGIPAAATESVPASLRIPGATFIAPVGDARALAERMQEAMAVQPSADYSEAVRRLASPAVVAEKLTRLFESVIP